MTEKLYSFRTLSSKRCTSCGKFLKQRLVETKEPWNVTLCYKCGRLSRGQEPRGKKREEGLSNA